MGRSLWRHLVVCEFRWRERGESGEGRLQVSKGHKEPLGPALHPALNWPRKELLCPLLAALLNARLPGSIADPISWHPASGAAIRKGERGSLTFSLLSLIPSEHPPSSHKGKFWTNGKSPGQRGSQGGRQGCTVEQEKGRAAGSKSLILERSNVEEQIRPNTSAALLQFCSPASHCRFLGSHLSPLGLDCPPRSNGKLWMLSAEEFWQAGLGGRAFSEVAPTLSGIPLSGGRCTPHGRSWPGEKILTQRLFVVLVSHFNF